MKKLKRENDVPEDYYDDLGNGVRDLGVGEIEKENPDIQKKYLRISTIFLILQ